MGEKGEPVISIGKSAFYGNNHVKEVAIPDSVMRIDDRAFYCCDSLTSVVIGNSVTEIGCEAFGSCDNLLNISLVEDQILVLVKDNKMIANIRGIHSKNTYIEKLYSANFINELEIMINEINYDNFNDILEQKEKNIILLGSESEKDVNAIFNLLNKMVYNYDINVNFLNVNNSDLNNKVKEKLETIGYNGAVSYPLVIISESNRILGYAIGNSKEEYFIDIFIENGVIKGDAING